MDNNVIKSSAIGPSGFSIEAEKSLIRDVLELQFFKDVTSIHRRFAIYPNTNSLHKDRVIELLLNSIWKHKDLFEIYRKFESFFLAIGKRGHYVHQLEVFLLGANILMLSQKKGVDLLKFFKFESFEDIIYTWLFASTAHDFGYSIEASSNIFEDISKMYADFGFTSLSKSLKINVAKQINDGNELEEIDISDGVSQKKINIKDIIHKCLAQTLEIDDSAITRLQEKFERNLSHGYIGSIIIYKYLSRVLTERVKENHYNIEWFAPTINYVLGSISTHSFNVDEKDEDKCYGEYIDKISFDKNPYAYLLFIVDNLQDWDRGAAEDENWPTYYLSEFKSSLENSTITMRYAVTHRTWSREDGTDLKKIVEKDLDKKRQIIDMLSTPTDRVGINIEVHFCANTSLDIESIHITI